MPTSSNQQPAATSSRPIPQPPPTVPPPTESPKPGHPKYHSMFLKHVSYQPDSPATIAKVLDECIPDLYNVTPWDHVSEQLASTLHSHVQAKLHVKHQLILYEPQPILYQQRWDEHHNQQLLQALSFDDDLDDTLNCTTPTQPTQHTSTTESPLHDDAAPAHQHELVDAAPPFHPAHRNQHLLQSPPTHVPSHVKLSNVLRQHYFAYCNLALCTTNATSTPTPNESGSRGSISSSSDSSSSHSRSLARIRPHPSTVPTALPRPPARP